ncbi:MAG: dockerin type I repeat-containing protein [Candidatus Bipolaricaulota bacterium]|nr:dockerin type I repeat-containing protein [Candidatus Bipolaricaulota bacterium]MDW8031335.1 dockerin type I repeat-containing protein [Candidatus Bipolaricaulota bacterium]
MKHRLWVFVLVPILVLGWAATVWADDETDVFNANAGNTEPNPNPGENFVVIQDVIVADPGPFGDTTPDSFPTAIETVTIRKAGGTLPSHYILALRLYLDDGDGQFDPTVDRLLGAVTAPQLMDFWEGTPPRCAPPPTGTSCGVVFGEPGQLLVLVPNGGSVEFFVVADFANDAPDGATLRTSFDLTVGDSLIGGPTTTSRIDSATSLPILNFDSGLPVPVGFIRITAATGDAEVDVIDETPARTANPGDSVVLQEFLVSDPGVSGDAVPDGHGTLIRSVTVRKVGGTISSDKILRLRLFRASPRTPPGWDEQDELLAVVNSPDLERGVVFGDGGRRLVRVNDNAEERFYIVADLAAVGFVNGDTLRVSVELVARDDKTDPGELSSAIETPMPVVASNQLVVEVPPPTLIIGSAAIVGKAKIPIIIRFVPAPGLGELQIGPDGALTFDPTVVQILNIRGVGPYVVDSVNIDSVEGRAQFTLTLKPGRTPLNEGVIAEIEIDKAPDAPIGESITIDIEDIEGIEVVDVFRDAAGRDLLPDIVPGTITIKLIKGDVDGDGVVTISDARLTARFILGLETLTPEQEEAADVAPPVGVIDATDVRWIAQAAAGLRKLEQSNATRTLLAVNKPAHTVVAKLRAKALEVRLLGPEVTQMTVRVFTLTGKAVAVVQVPGPIVRLSESELAGLPNGIYLYTVTALGPNGVWQSDIQKFVLVR